MYVHPAILHKEQRTSLKRQHLFVLLAFLYAGLFAHIHRAAAQATAAPLAAPTTPPPAYDVMAIKPDRSASGNVDIDTNRDSFSATNVSLKQLLEYVYNIKQDLISGLSGPIESSRFDIEAKITAPDREVLQKMTRQQSRQMLLPLLAERFQLKTHTETKILPVFDLVVLPSGSKFKLSANQKEHGGGSTSVNGSRAGTKLNAREITMASLARSIAGAVHRTVIDKTGLIGNFDLTLQWSDDNNPDSGAALYPAIFTAIEEQLGLKLQTAKGPVETLVVDHAEMPGDN